MLKQLVVHFHGNCCGHALIFGQDGEEIPRNKAQRNSRTLRKCWNARTHARTHTNTNARTHTRAHTHTHTHTNLTQTWITVWSCCAESRAITPIMLTSRLSNWTKHCHILLRSVSVHTNLPASKSCWQHWTGTQGTMRASCLLQRTENVSTAGKLLRGRHVLCASKALEATKCS